MVNIKTQKKYEATAKLFEALLDKLLSLLDYEEKNFIEDNRGNNVSD